MPRWAEPRPGGRQQHPKLPQATINSSFRESQAGVSLDWRNVASDPPAEGNLAQSPLVWLTVAGEAVDAFERALTVRGYQVVAHAIESAGEEPEPEVLPDIWLLDAGMPNVATAVANLRGRIGGPTVELIFLAVGELPKALAPDASGVFPADTDPEQVIKKLDALTGLESIPPLVSAQPSTLPPPTAGARAESAAVASGEEAIDDAQHEGPAPSQRAGVFLDEDPSHPSLPAPVPLGFSPDAGAPKSAPQAEMSPELESLLARAEQRVQSLAKRESSDPAPPRPTPEQEIEAVLPAEVLAALDEPLDLDDEDKLDSDDDSDPGTRSGSGPRTGYGTNIGTSGGSYGGAGTGQGPGLGTAAGGPMSSRAPSEGGATGGAEPTAPPPRRNLGSEPPQTVATPPSDAKPRPPSWPVAPANAMVTAIEARPGTGPASDAESLRGQEPPRPIAPMTAEPRITFRGPEPNVEGSAADADAPKIPAVLGSGDGLRALAQAVRSRFTGAIAFEDPAGIRRVVFRDGDFVIAASGANSESLMAFLIERGVLGPEIAQRLGARTPPFGRYAGAALIANGHLRQDELWPVLRAHAEWVVGHVMTMESGGASIEREVPPRLQAEPAVFGGATGAEVLVEVARRVVLPDAALAQLGGPNAVLATGDNHNLLSECALTKSEATLTTEALGNPIGDVLQELGDPSLPPMLCALVALGVLQVDTAPARGGGAASSAPQKWDALDEHAMRERILARRALVEESDYFSLLGVPRRATSYDVRRAYTELRRDFEPGRILTAGCADLKDDVDLIVEVLEEAYEILRDNLRRERYRRALESVPR